MIRLIKSICARSNSPARSIKYNSKGAALPIVLAMLGLGALVITPFLNHAGVDLKSSAGYTALMQANNSCEAGIEEAIWALNYNHLSDQFSKVGDTLNYSLTQSVNQTYPSISVTLLNSEGGITQGTPGLIGDNVVAGDSSGQSGIINTYEIDSAAGGSSITATVSIVDKIVSVLAWDIGR